MDSKAALHSGCGRATGPILMQARRSSASSTLGTTPQTGVSPLRARVGIMVRAVEVPRLRGHRASAAGSNQAADSSAVRAEPARSESLCRPSQNQRPNQSPNRAEASTFRAGCLLRQPLGRSLATGRYPFGLLLPRHGGVSSGMDISITWTTRAICTKSMCRSWAPEPKRRAHDRRSEMRVSLTGSRPMMAAISSLIGSMVPMMPSTILRRTGRRTVAVTAWSSRYGPTLKPKARMCRSR